MVDAEGRRARKSINYAEFADATCSDKDDDDFDDDFKTSSKSRREKPIDKAERGNGEDRKEDRERRHKDKHKDHKKHKDKDRDRHKKDKDRHKERHNREGGERRDDHRSRHESRRKEHNKERRHRSERRDEKSLDDPGRSEGSSDGKYDSSDSQRIYDSSATSTTTASPLVSPSRRNPKPRLSLEEKMFQKELEAALELSKHESPQGSTRTPDAQEHNEKRAEAGLDVQTTPSPNSQQENSTRGGHSVFSHNSESIEKASSSVPAEIVVFECVQDEDKLPDIPVSSRVAQLPAPSTVQSIDLIEPQPSTSTGLGLKRTRKTVNFKEDSDSSDFDGFGNNSGDSDASEESDFMPSPKKKKQQKSKDLKKTTKTSKQTKTNVCKSSAKTPEKNTPVTNQVVSPPIGKRASKENTAPQSPTNASPLPARGTPASPIVSIASKSKGPSLSPKTPPTNASTTKNTSIGKPVKRPLSNASSSQSTGAASITLVKTPFRSPLTTSPGSGHLVSSAPSVGAKSLIQRGTGLRLGLSRRAIIKPLHPSVAAKITD